MSEFAEFSAQPFKITPITEEAKEIVDFQNLPRISEIIARGDSKELSPFGLRQLAEKYTNAGIKINQVEGLSQASVQLQYDGTISADVPSIKAGGNDMVAVHSFAHVEQLMNGLKDTVAPTDIARSSWDTKAIAEIGALELSLRYAGGLHENPRNSGLINEKNADMIQKAKERLELRKKDLSEAGIQYTENQKLSPYRKIT